jgi:peptidyl-tRNA hydrolase
MDLKMGLGKVAAQCAHAKLKVYQRARSRVFNDEKYSLTFINWLKAGQEKVAYLVEDETELSLSSRNSKARFFNEPLFWSHSHGHFD